MSEKPKSTPKSDPGPEAPPQTPWAIRERLFDSSLSQEERMKAVFGKEGPPEAGVEKAPELDPKLRERVERAMGTMYNQLGRIYSKRTEQSGTGKNYFIGKMGEYKMAGDTFGEKRLVEFTKGGKVLRFEFQSPTKIILWFDNNSIAYYDFSPDLPPSFREYQNVGLLVEKLEQFSALLDSNTQSDLQDSIEGARDF